MINAFPFYVYLASNWFHSLWLSAMGYGGSWFITPNQNRKEKENVSAKLHFHCKQGGNVSTQEDYRTTEQLQKDTQKDYSTSAA